MGLLQRRFPVHTRPAIFIPVGLLGLVSLVVGLGWSWEWSLQTGHVFLLLNLPATLVAPGVVQVGFLLAAFVCGATVAAFGLPNPRWLQPRRRARGVARFFPVMFLLGLFLVGYGFGLLFEASTYGDRVPGGFVVFVYLNYAGLADRPVVSLVGIALLSAGALCATRFAFAPGPGPGPAPAPRPGPANPLLPRVPTPLPLIRPGPARPAPATRALLSARPAPASARVRTAASVLQGAAPPRRDVAGAAARTRPLAAQDLE